MVPYSPDFRLMPETHRARPFDTATARISRNQDPAGVGSRL
jgi:hypothetical protein